MDSHTQQKLLQCIYNADLVDGVPTTWDEVKAACDAAGTEICVGAPGGGGGGDAYHNHPFFAI